MRVAASDRGGSCLLVPKISDCVTAVSHNDTHLIASIISVSAAGIK